MAVGDEQIFEDSGNRRKFEKKMKKRNFGLKGQDLNCFTKVGNSSKKFGFFLLVLY